MHAQTSIQTNAQRGSFLLEAMIGILIFAFGILGIIGLQAQSMKLTNESQFRAEAAYLANALLGRMWAEQTLSTLEAKYDADSSGVGFVAFRDAVVAALPNGDASVQVNNGADPAPPSTSSAVVHIIVSWQAPGEDAHRFETIGIVGQN